MHERAWNGNEAVEECKLEIGKPSHGRKVAPGCSRHVAIEADICAECLRNIHVTVESPVTAPPPLEKLPLGTTAFPVISPTTSVPPAPPIAFANAWRSAMQPACSAGSKLVLSGKAASNAL
jgi:hypothetical protein